MKNLSYKLAVPVISLISLFISTSTIAEVLSPRSGNVGDYSREARVNSSFLRGFMVLEKFDRPCVVQLYGTLVGQSNYEGRIEECNGSGPTTGPYSAQTFISGGSSYVTGIKVCHSNSNRVKGYTLYGRAFGSPFTLSDSYERANCNDWQTRVNCPTDTRAIGVKAYFMNGSGSRSDSLTGIRLICE
ncbi:MAG: hypothetical protein HWE16_01815 [Gammaproteobacteria bacterium]|nr:hypothetical protein [Gammaproteobacteria bacterium]